MAGHFSAEFAKRGYVCNRGNYQLLSTGIRRSFNELRDSYRDLAPDVFLPLGDRYRFRRYSAFRVDPVSGSVRAVPTQPYRQSRDVNTLVGGIDRYFQPLSREIVKNAVIMRLLIDGVRHFEELSPSGPGSWYVDVHSVRIIARWHLAGSPSPEGIHRDGFDYISMHLIDRYRVFGGVSRIYNNERQLLARFCLREPLDCVYLNDSNFLHDVTPIKALAKEGHRDVLLMSYRRH